MAGTLAMRELLNAQFMSDAFHEMASVHSNNPMLDFFGSSPKQVSGDEIQVPYYNTTKKMAPMTDKGVPATSMEAIGATKYYYSPHHVFVEVPLPLYTLEYLRNDSSHDIQQKGHDEIVRQMEAVAHRVNTTRAVTLAKTLQDGVVYTNDQGVVLESSSGAARTHDLQVGSTHKSKLAHASNGGSDIIAAAWDTASTKILQHLDQIKMAAEYDNAPPPKHIWLHSTAKQWFRANTELKAYFEQNQMQANTILSGDIVDINGYTFHFYDGTYEASDGTTKDIIGRTKAIITPDIGDWFFNADGDELVPASEGMMNTADEAMGQVNRVFGDYSYAKLTDNPPSLMLRMGTNFLYAFKQPNAVWMPLVDF